MSDTQAIAARLTAIAERLDKLDSWSDASFLRYLLAHVETLTQQVAETDERARLNYPGLAEVERIQQENAHLTADLQEQSDRCDRADEAYAKAEQQRDAAHAALREVEQHCPCGARPESLRTHPHVIGCPVGNVLYPAPAQETERGR